MTGTIFDIKEFSIHDGPGARTTVFLKGCPMRCKWCHNPEGIRKGRQLSYREDRCVYCGACAAVCPVRVHMVHANPAVHDVTFSRCRGCGSCVDACAQEALEISGYELTVGEAVKRLLKDRKYYGKEGGVTLSGGEAALQKDFCIALLGELKKKQVHCALETNGAHPVGYYDSFVIH